MENIQKKLADLLPGESARVIDFTDSWISEKLMEMGCIPGSLVHYIKKAPFGDPIIIHFDECQLTMRRSEANCIVVSGN